MKKYVVGLLALFASIAVYAGVQVQNSSQVVLGTFEKIYCSTGITCTQDAGRLKIVSSPTLAGSITAQGAEGAAGIINVQADESDDNADDWAVSALAAGTFQVQTGTSGSLVGLTTWSSTGDVVFGGTTPYVTLGDAGAEDAGLAFDGNAQDFNISLDDSTDDLVIGLGTAAGTTDAIRIDENQDVTFVQNVLGLGTDSLSGFLQKQVASTTTSITAVQCGSTFVSDSADVMTLPEASTVLGCRLTFVCGTADDFDINPADASDAYGPINSVAGGTGAAITPAGGDAIRCTDIGSSIVIEAVGANLWVPVGVANGAWTDVN